MRVAIHQPQYWPWPRYVHKVLAADTFVYLDDVQFSKNGVQNRNQVLAGGSAQWLTLPVRHASDQEIRETRLGDRRAPGKHFRTLQMNYSKAPGFQRWRDELEALLAGTDSELLSDYAIATTEWMLEKLEATTERVRSSELETGDVEGSARVAALCDRLGADAYLSGTGALDYMERSDFDAVGCEVWVQEWHGLTYDQGGGEFVPDLSTLDLLLWAPDDAPGLLREAGGWRRHW